MKVYPSKRYHPTEGSRVVMSEAQDQALGHEWVHSPADYGHETCPGVTPDPVVAAKGEEYKKRIQALKAPQSQEPKRPGRPKRTESKEAGIE